jgi:hypothetical protein
VTCALFMTDGNLPAAKDELAREESICENSRTHDSMIGIGMISRGDVGEEKFSS